jgi:hypothetical protein
MHLRPGHTKPVACETRSPSLASTVLTTPRLSSRSANVRVNLSGMCCATTNAAVVVTGSLPKMLSRALGPPVELAMATRVRGAR